MDTCPQAPNKRPHTQDASLRSMHRDRRMHRKHRACPGVTFFFADATVIPIVSEVENQA